MKYINFKSGCKIYHYSDSYTSIVDRNTNAFLWLSTCTSNGFMNVLLFCLLYTSYLDSVWSMILFSNPGATYCTLYGNSCLMKNFFFFVLIFMQPSG